MSYFVIYPSGTGSVTAYSSLENVVDDFPPNMYEWMKGPDEELPFWEDGRILVIEGNVLQLKYSNHGEA